MKLFKRLSIAYGRWSTWATANRHKLLKDMPLWYLFVMAALSGMGAMLAQPLVSRATPIYLDELLPVAPWPISMTIGLLLLFYWILLGMFALVAATHGRALGDRLFNSATN